MGPLVLHISGDLTFDVLGRPVGYYGLCIVAGLALALALAHHQCRVHGRSFDEVVELACVGGLCGLVGAKLLYLAVNAPLIDFGRLFSDGAYAAGLLGGGFVFYGGVIGGLAGAALYGRVRGIDVWGLLDVCAPCLPLGHALGRVGCLVAGCCYGVPWDGPLSVVYDHSPIAPDGVALFPVQAVEALCNLALAGVLAWACNCRLPRGGAAGAATSRDAAADLRAPRRGAGAPPGLALYLLLYGVERFLLEFARYDAAERGMWGPLSTSQWISLALVAGSALYLAWRRMRPRPPQAGAACDLTQA